MGQCDRNRDAVDDGRNTKRGLKENRSDRREDRQPQRPRLLDAPYVHGESGRQDCERVSQDAMGELSRQRVLEEIDVPGGKRIEPGGMISPPISGQVFEACPAFRPATNPPPIICR